MLPTYTRAMSLDLLSLSDEGFEEQLGWTGSQAVGVSFVEANVEAKWSDSLKSTPTPHKVHLRHPAQLLFAFSGLPKNGFPFTLLSSMAFHRIWLNRCAARFERVPPRVLLGFIIDDFSNACCRHFSALRLSRTKKGKKTLKSHMEASATPPLLLFSPQGITLLHAQFKHIWLFCEPFHPP